MEIKNNINLKDHLTMRLGGQAKYMVEINCKEDIKNAYQYAEDHGLKVFILGGGSNTLATDKGFDGLVMLMKIKGTEVIAERSEKKEFYSLSFSGLYETILSLLDHITIHIRCVYSYSSSSHMHLPHIS